MAKKQIKNYIFSPGIGATGNLFSDAYSLISSNKSFIQKEATAWIAEQVSASTPGFVGYTYNQSKCERDLGYVLDAYLYDLRYGGNSETSRVIHYYWDEDVAQVDGDRQPEIQTHTFIGELIADYILTNTAYSASNTEVTQTIDLTKSVTNLQYTPTAATYTPTTGNLTLTIGTHNLSVDDEIFIAPNSIVFTCLLDGNATTHAYPRGSGVPNLTGKDPYYYAPIKITSKTATTITVNVGVSSDTTIHTFVSADPNCVTSGAFAKINTLVFNTVDVITNGLTALPTHINSGVGTITFQGRYTSDTILLITNTTKNEVIYNFTSVDYGGTVELKTNGVDENFPTYEQITDAVTKITLNYDTSSHSSTDDIQIFVEEAELRVRPYDFGTDAIERHRMAAPLSMLDADFEYGLQPTKWSAISTLRGYPSVYEIPGTDTPVVSVTTDASTGTSGVGQSLITITTVGPHGFSAGDPITVKALADSVNGAARAEGSFVIVSVPSTTTLTYYAKAKVGTTNGQVLSTNYTQLRKAGFYTGSTIGSPSFTLVSNGSSGSFTTQLIVPSGSTIIPYDGTSPAIGSPLVATSIPLGTQVTQIYDTSAGGGTYITPVITQTTFAGNNRVYIEDPSGIVENLAADRGDGVATFVTSVHPTYLDFSSNFTDAIIPNKITYAAVSGANDSSSGNSATFDIAISGGAYVLSSIASSGSSYKVGDRIIISGTDLDGLSPDNDALIIVDSIGTLGSISTASISGTPFDGELSFTGLTATPVGGVGTGASFDVTYLDGAYTAVALSTGASTLDFKVGDIIVIPGNVVSATNGSSFHDLYIRVETVGGLGDITSVTYSGTAPAHYASYLNPIYTTSGTGSGATFTVVSNSGAYEVTLTAPGIDFLPTDTITILGTALGGATPANDLTITVDNVGGLGDITAISTSGTAKNGATKTSLAGSNRTGSGATFDVNVSGGAYSVTVAGPGTGYGTAQDYVILGTALGGATPANDLTITVDTVSTVAEGTITAISTAGTAISAAAGPFSGISGTNQPAAGIDATFNIARDFTVYSTIQLANAGSGYRPGNRIVIPGGSLDGVSPANDITIRVLTVSGAGETGPIASFTSSYGAAAYGTNFDLISTVTTTEATTAQIAKDTTVNFESLATIRATFGSPHGLVPGDSFIVVIRSDDGINNHSLAGGGFFATSIPSLTTLEYQARAAGNIDATNAIVGAIYPRPDSFFIHRPFDGGVQLGTGGPQHGAQAIRQSKKYIRYQSGKGIMYTTGALFAPSYDLRSVTADGVEVNSLITVVTDDNDHGVQVGGIIRLLGIVTPGYNSGRERGTPPDFDYEVVDVVDERTFKVRAQRRLGSTTAELGFGAQMSVVSWHGATVRSGIFDDQNGIFWEYDGTNISVNQRTGTRQLSGTVAINVEDNLMTGTNTRFRDQVKAGDRVVIRGMTHVVTNVISNTSMAVTPDWRGVTSISGAKINLVVDKKVKQRDFNIDRLDGTGPSGYEIDPAKMQMIGIQYSWYGAGFIDFMLRGSNGNFVFCHRMRNSNVNTEAFMRSGNLPVRYEVTNEGPPGRLAAAMDASQTYMDLDDASFFPDFGTLYVDNEIISFDGKDENRLLNCVRATTLDNFQAGADRSYSAGSAASHDAKTGVVLISNTITPLISHWGSAFLTDGGFDSDRGYLFSYAETNVSVSTTKKTAFMIRLAPSVSNAIVGDLGERELLNRAQLLLQGIEVTSETGTGGIVLEGVLNPQNFPTDPASVSWQGLSGVAQGGQPSFAQIAAGGGITWTTSAAVTTATVTSAAFPTGSIVLKSEYGQAVFSGWNFFYLRENDYQNYASSGLAIGDYISGSGIPADTQITSISSSFEWNGRRYRYLNISKSFTSNLAQDTSVTVTKRYNTSNTSVIWFNPTSFAASGAKIGTDVSTTETKFPAGTAISNVNLRTYFSSSYYEVVFNKTSNSTTITPGTTSVIFSFSQPPFAQPGETIFSFIANPGERSTLDLTELKELTNTPLGGRGTFPNGPDILAINVYKVSGAAVNANVIVRWGEAQA